MFKKMIAFGAILALCAGVSYALTLNGAGATFPYPIYMKWNKLFSESHKVKTSWWQSLFSKNGGIEVNYQGIGSGGGIRQFSAGTVDFGGTDAFMSDEQISKAGGDVLHIPTVMGAVAVCYNLEGVEDLKLDGQTLADIFLGKTNKWNEKKIAEINPGIDLPDLPIIVCHRSDGSGTTNIFTSYLAKVSPDWDQKVGKGKAVDWPEGLGGKGNAGVAGLIKVNKGSIGYVELSYAITNKLPVIALKNKAGKFVKPSLEATSFAASGILESKSAMKKVNAGDFRLDLTDAPGDKAYPIVGMTWLLVHKNQKDKAKGEALVEYLKWALSDGQKYAADLLYAPLPKEMAEKVLKEVNTIKINSEK
jgi:phosphate transport system substrate-binding protein